MEKNLKAIVLINKSSGTVLFNQITQEQISELFAKENIEAEIYIDSFQNLKLIVIESLNLKNTDIIVAGGGDGTISSIAELLIGSSIPLGVLPLGTLNHFSKDIGLPNSLEECIKVISENNIENIDIGQINGKIFINNSSIGIYPQIVKYRNQWQEKYHLNKWVSIFFAGIKTFIYYPKFEIFLDIQDKEIGFKTPFVFIGNNQYTMKIFTPTPSRRESLKDGKLSLYTYTHTSRANLVKLFLAFIFGNLHKEKYFRSLSVPELTIISKKKRLAVSMDGEITYMQPPLNYKILPGQLKVICPIKESKQI